MRISFAQAKWVASSSYSSFPLSNINLVLAIILDSSLAYLLFFFLGGGTPKTHVPQRGGISCLFFFSFLFNTNPSFPIRIGFGGLYGI